MLKNYILATNVIYINIFHTKNNIKKYIKILDRIFKDISKNNINNILKSKECFKPKSSSAFAKCLNHRDEEAKKFDVIWAKNNAPKSFKLG